MQPKVRAYIAKMNKLMREVGKLKRSNVKQLPALLEQARKELEQVILTTPEERFKAYYAKALIAEIENRMAEYERRLRDVVQLGQEQAWELAGLHTSELIKALVPDAPVLALPRNLLEIAQGFSADLITGLTRDAIRKISTEINLAILTGKTPYELMQRIGKNLKSPGIFKTIAARAETITRTELGRVYSMARQVQMEQSAQNIPELMKTWVSVRWPTTRRAHWDAHGQTVKASESFIVGGEKLKYPHDPNGSAWNTVNCRCNSVPIVPSLEEEWRQELEERKQRQEEAYRRWQERQKERKRLRRLKLLKKSPDRKTN